MDSRFTIKIKEICHDWGADLVGVANIERFANAPFKLSPQNILPTARSVIVCSIHLPDACVELAGEPDPQVIGPYKVTDIASQKLTIIAFNVAKYLDKLGYHTIPIDITDKKLYKPYRHTGYEEVDAIFAPDMSHIYASIAAGLSGLGWNGLSLNPENGPRSRYISIITEAELRPDPLLDGETLCDKCFKCAKSCPHQALSGSASRKIKIDDKVYERADKNLWKCAWAEHFMLDLNTTLPDEVDENVLIEQVAQKGTRINAIANCYRYCMIPELRLDDPSYTRVHRRKRTNANTEIVMHRGVRDEILSIGAANFLNHVSFLSADTINDAGINLGEFLPGAKSVITLGFDFVNPNSDLDSNKDMLKPFVSPWRQATVKLNQYEQIAQLNVDLAALEIAQELESKGYTTIYKTDIDEKKLAEYAGVTSAAEPYPKGFFQANNAIITNAKVKEDLYHISDTVKLHPCENLTGHIKNMCTELCVDLFGVSSVLRINQVKEQLKNVKQNEEILNADDLNGRFLPFEPYVESRKRNLYSPSDYIKDAKSVLVIGLSYPGIISERAGDLNTDIVGPYVFSQHQTQIMLGRAGMAIVKYLHGMNYEAVYSYDCLGVGSKNASPLGLIYDSFCNTFEAVCAGLGEMAFNGTVITREFGGNQRFLAIVTNAPLEISTMQIEGLVNKYCLECRHCFECCPSQAFVEERLINLNIDGNLFTYIPIDTKRCDWSSKFCLCGDEGMKYLGADTNIFAPKEINETVLKEALRKTDPILKHRQYSIERCIVECPLTSRVRL